MRTRVSHKGPSETFRLREIARVGRSLAEAQFSQSAGWLRECPIVCSAASSDRFTSATLSRVIWTMLEAAAPRTSARPRCPLPEITSQPTCIQRAGVRCNACTNAQRSQERLKYRRANASRSGKRTPQSYLVAPEPLQASMSFKDDLPNFLRPPRTDSSTVMA